MIPTPVRFGSVFHFDLPRSLPHSEVGQALAKAIESRSIRAMAWKSPLNDGKLTILTEAENDIQRFQERLSISEAIKSLGKKYKALNSTYVQNQLRKMWEDFLGKGEALQLKQKRNPRNWLY